MRILVTGGAGLVGAQLALSFKADMPKARVTALDNLCRHGSALSVPRLMAAGVTFRHGDVRNPEDLDAAGPFDLLVDCAAEPSVHAGYGGDPRYLINTNLVGTLNSLEAARRHKGALILLSTSRVYPLDALRAIRLRDGETRLELEERQDLPGLTAEGIALDFPMQGKRSLYGGTKLSAEVMAEEYAGAYDMPVIINRCGILTGPWQMGKVDQGVVALWAAAHVYGLNLRYIGYGGLGLQVRDMLHTADLYGLISRQLSSLNPGFFGLYPVGGGIDGSASLRELTALCAAETGASPPIGATPETTPADIPWFVTDSAATRAAFGWAPTRRPRDIVAEIVAWITENKTMLAPVFGANTN